MLLLFEKVLLCDLDFTFRFIKFLQNNENSDNMHCLFYRIMFRILENVYFLTLSVKKEFESLLKRHEFASI